MTPFMRNLLKELLLSVTTLIGRRGFTVSLIICTEFRTRIKPSMKATDPTA